jgi:peptidoglycan hydrolase-like protein with peptidoglycan-binding domain
MFMRSRRWLLAILIITCVVPFGPLGQSPAHAELSRPSRLGLQWPILRRGVHGVEVSALQHLLRARGYQVVVDGNFGAQTFNRVRNFQTARHLTVDGVVGTQTWEALILTVRRGQSGSAVRAVQLLLRRADINIPVDGVFGSATESAVKRFQRRVTLIEPVDGVVRPTTWCYLLGGTLDGE